MVTPPADAGLALYTYAQSAWVAGVHRVATARRATAADDRGEGVISAGIVVLIMAAIGLAMWVAFNAMWQDVESKTKANVDQIGTPAAAP